MSVKQKVNQPVAIKQPEVQAKRYDALFYDIERGDLKLPMFQRDFVWDKEQTAKLIDSILKGYPIGTFILWKTREDLRSFRNLGGHDLPATPKGDYAHFILDGQQRITSLYAVRRGLRITREGKEVDYCDIYIDLELEPGTDEQVVVASIPTKVVDGEEVPKRSISVHDALTRSNIDLEDDYTRPEREIIFGYQMQLAGYDFSTVVIRDYPIEVACEVFARINTGGKELSVFEIMVAKTYDEKLGFDLAEQFDYLRDGYDDDNDEPCLRRAGFETISHAAVMQCVAAIAVKAVRSKDILRIKRDQFIAHWKPMKDSLFEAVDFVRHTLRIPVSQLVPYASILVPLTYFFNKTKNRKPTAKQRKLIEQWFYWVGYTYRYSSGAETKLAEDLAKMDKIIKELPPRYPAEELKVLDGAFDEWGFSAGDAACKTVLCLLAYHQPKSFDSNAVVNLDNSNLKIATSKNYHHFFPKAYLAENLPQAEANLMVNITLIDGYGNKHRIGKKPPSVYIRKFADENDKIADSLQTHLIGDLEDFGITTDDYDTFIKKRGQAMARVLRGKLNPKVA